MNNTTATKRVLTTVATAALWLAGAGGGFAAEPPPGPTYTNSLGMGFVRFEPGALPHGGAAARTGTGVRTLMKCLRFLKPETWCV